MRNRAKFRAEKVSGEARLALAVTLALAISSCNSTGGVDRFCEELPTARSEVSAFRSAIGVHAPAKGRKIASAAEEPSVEARLGWLSWTEKALKKTQWARDALEHEKGARKAMPVLSEASLSLVSIHGFIEQRKWGKASSELEQVEKDLARASELLCTEKAQARIAAEAKAEEAAEKKAAGKDRQPASQKRKKRR